MAVNGAGYSVFNLTCLPHRQSEAVDIVERAQGEVLETCGVRLGVNGPPAVFVRGHCPAGTEDALRDALTHSFIVSKTGDDQTSIRFPDPNDGLGHPDWGRVR